MKINKENLMTLQCMFDSFAVYLSSNGLCRSHLCCLCILRCDDFSCDLLFRTYLWTSRYSRFNSTAIAHILFKFLKYKLFFKKLLSNKIILFDGNAGQSRSRIWFSIRRELCIIAILSQTRLSLTHLAHSKEREIHRHSTPLHNEGTNERITHTLIANSP